MLGQLLIALVILVGVSLFMSNINIVAHIGGIHWWFINNFSGYYYKVNRNIFWILLVGMLIHIYCTSN